MIALADGAKVQAIKHERWKTQLERCSGRNSARQSSRRRSHGSV
jgi:hypothetical protein